MAARLSRSEAAALGIVPPPAQKRTRRQAAGPYRTYCWECAAVFDRVVDEDRHHEQTGHCRYQIPLDGGR